MSSYEKIPIFPLPDFVAFPGQVHHFHIFEPRYRAMIRHCLDHECPLGVALGYRQITNYNFKEPAEDDVETLSMNRNLFEPADVFGVGQVELLESLPDGRMMVKVEIDRTVHCRKIVQMLPFFVGEIETSHWWIENPAVCEAYYDRLMTCARQLLGDNYHILIDHLNETEREEKALYPLVSAITSSVQLEAPLAQSILEECCLDERAALLTHVLESSLGLEPEKPEPLHGGELIKIDFRAKTLIDP